MAAPKKQTRDSFKQKIAEEYFIEKDGTKNTHKFATGKNKPGRFNREDAKGVRKITKARKEREKVSKLVAAREKQIVQRALEELTKRGNLLSDNEGQAIQEIVKDAPMSLFQMVTMIEDDASTKKAKKTHDDVLAKLLKVIKDEKPGSPSHLKAIDIYSKNYDFFSVPSVEKRRNFALSFVEAQATINLSEKQAALLDRQEGSVDQGFVVITQKDVESDEEIEAKVNKENQSVSPVGEVN